ncbi:MAG: aminotransferase class V-fold PLP-dependent enzyme, partial [Betaproteobacteria bacterium]
MHDITHLLRETADRAARYLESLDERSVAPASDAIDALAAFDVPLQNEAIDPAKVLAQLDSIGSPATMAVAGPRFFGYVVGGALPASVAANWLAAAWDQKTAYASASPATSALEHVVLTWMLDLLRFPPTCAGGFVTGTTAAHITALAAARHAVLAKAGWNVEADGLFGAPPITVIVGSEAHASLYKALGVVGLGRSRVMKVPVDDQGRMRADALPRIVGPTIVCAQVGSVNTGACDPVGEICDVAHARSAWVHIDGAFGLWARVAPSRAHLVEGLELADSWATDCHKWLNVPYDSGMAFVRDGNALRAAMAVTAEYLPAASAQR